MGVDVFMAKEVGANEAIVVYSAADKTATAMTGIVRSVIRGPTIYTPRTANDWLHQFEWHGVDPEALSAGINRKIAGQLTFKKLRLVPDQLYYDVEKVRTRDDALLTGNTM